MTTTLHPDSTWTPTTDVLRSLLDDALDVAADDAAGSWSSGTPAGRTLLTLAALARRAVGVLGAERGISLTAGPGVVVQRELAAAARLLDEAAEGADGEPEGIAELLVPAQRLLSELLETEAAALR